MEFCDESEIVLHAVLEAHWDCGRVSTDLLEGKSRSVSRLSVYCEKEIFAIFHRDLDKPGRSPVVAALEWQVREISETSKTFFIKTKQNKEPLKVRVDALPENAAHAEIDGKVTKGLSKKLVPAGRTRREGWVKRFVYRVLGLFRLRHRLGAAMAPVRAES